MEKKAKLEKAIEVFVLLTFPIALVVGCADTGNVQPKLQSTQELSTTEQRYDTDGIYPLFANDANSLDANNLDINNLDINKKVADVVVITKDSEPVSESNSAMQVTVDKTTDDIVINQSMNPMMTVSFTDDVAENNEIIAESGTAMQDQSALLMLANTNEDVLVAGANSTLALMNDIEVQPNYLVFNFDSDSVKVHEYDHYFLKQHAIYLNSNPNMILKIRGHTDSRGSRIYNEELSKRRAETVKTLLVSFGAPESQIQLKGLGEIIPLSDESKMQENRRVELEYIDHTMMSAK